MRNNRATHALVTGGAGFIGSHLCEELLSRGFKVVALDDLSTGSKLNIAYMLPWKKRIVFIKGSILNERLMERLIKKTDIVYHLAAAVGVKLILDNPVESILTNIKGTEIILRLSARYGKKVFIASSSEVYGKRTHIPLKEDTDTLMGATNISRWSYANAKAADEFLSLGYFREKRLPVVVGRFFNIVGSRQVSSYGMVLPRLIEEALTGKPITVFGDGSQIRSFTYVKDAVRAVVDLTLTKEAEGKIFNIGNEEHISIRQLARKIKQKTGSKSKIKFIPYEKFYGKDFEDVKCRLCDLHKIKKVIRYSPKYSLDKIINLTIEYFKQQKH